MCQIKFCPGAKFPPKPGHALRWQTPEPGVQHNHQRAWGVDAHPEVNNY